MKKKLLALAFLLLLFGCSNKYDKDLGVSIDIMYAEGLHEFSVGDFTKSKRIFQAIADDYPFSDEAIEANIFLIWIFYIQDDLVSLEITVDAFLRYYVYNKYTPWVSYMSAMAQYEQMGDTSRDQTYTKDALVAFSEIIKRDPNSSFAKDSYYKLQVIKYNLAKKDMEVAYYYLGSRNYLASLRRYKAVSDLYSDTIFTQEALYRQTYIWLTLGVNDEAFRITSTLGYNYPNSIWYTKSKNLVEKYTEYKDSNNLHPNRVGK